MSKTLIQLNDLSERSIFEVKQITGVRNKELNTNLALALAYEFIQTNDPERTKQIIKKHQDEERS
jgi:hypothetical protein